MLACLLIDHLHTIEDGNGETEEVPGAPPQTLEAAPWFHDEQAFPPRPEMPGVDPSLLRLNGPLIPEGNMAFPGNSLQTD